MKGQRVLVWLPVRGDRYTSSRWWFQIFFIFIPTWGRFPFWLIFFRWVATINQSFFKEKNAAIPWFSICLKKKRWNLEVLASEVGVLKVLPVGSSPEKKKTPEIPAFLLRRLGPFLSFLNLCFDSIKDNERILLKWWFLNSSSFLIFPVSFCCQQTSTSQTLHPCWCENFRGIRPRCATTNQRVWLQLYLGTITTVDWWFRNPMTPTTVWIYRTL